ncbi:hypothetical protein [Deinococcus sp. ME38]|uniref:hypothetical protein n=1 Tax=Deinococcus sp. ME38 TaxID=3400344 RepID=UPI003B5AB5C3
MEPTLSDRHAHLAAALRHPLTRAPAGLPRPPGDQSRAKRLLREVRAAYALTHDHLSQIATAVPVGQPVAQEVIGGARRFILEQNLQDALALAAQARALPLTRTGVAVRTAALDNVSVAQEACDVAQAHPIAATFADLLREIRLLCPAATQVALNWTGRADETPVFARPQRDRRVILLLAGTQPVGTVQY